MDSVNSISSYVALLYRGINIGGKHIVPMKQLVELFTEAKCVNVRSYIQSGNVVFTAPPKVAKAGDARQEDRGPLRILRADYPAQSR